MNRWIALLRGINVGGKTSLPMKDLRALLADLDFENIQTYIQSGNCIFQTSRGDPDQIATDISEKIAQKAGFAPKAFILSPSELSDAIESNPYKSVDIDPKFIHFFFLAHKAEKPDLAPLKALAKPGDRYHLTDRVFYLLTPQGIGRSKLAEKFGKHIPVDMTARNLRTVMKLAELADA